jgi:hypothetical protein
MNATLSDVLVLIEDAQDTCSNKLRKLHDEIGFADRHRLGDTAISRAIVNAAIDYDRACYALAILTEVTK